MTTLGDRLTQIFDQLERDQTESAIKVRTEFLAWVVSRFTGYSQEFKEVVSKYCVDNTFDPLQSRVPEFTHLRFVLSQYGFAWFSIRQIQGAASPREEAQLHFVKISELITKHKIQDYSIKVFDTVKQT